MANKIKEHKGTRPRIHRSPTTQRADAQKKKKSIQSPPLSKEVLGIYNYNTKALYKVTGQVYKVTGQEAIKAQDAGNLRFQSRGRKDGSPKIEDAKGTSRRAPRGHPEITPQGLARRKKKMPFTATT